MIDFPNCKINLGLQITGKRDDGYHNLATIFYPVQVKDALEIIPAKETSLTVSGVMVDGDWKDNICYKAYELLNADFGLDPIKINLLKNIPMGAGLGGGSADGAFMLMLLNKHFELGLSKEKLAHYALKLGSDCPFFIYNKPVYATGRGEEITEIELDLSAYAIYIVNPGIHISTGEAFADVKIDENPPSLKEIIQSPVEEWKENLKNAFEDSVLPKHNKIKQIKQDLYDQGALYASMTGSGSSVFGIFKKSQKIDREKFPNCRLLRG